MAFKRLLIDDALIVMVFPESPYFNQWLDAKYNRELVPSWRQGIKGEAWFTPEGQSKPYTMLVNWADDDSRMNFHIVSYPTANHFVDTSEFRYLKERFDGITVRGVDHLIFNDIQDIVMFRMMYGDAIKVV